VIRVCHVITGLYTGGAEMMLYRLLAATDRRRFAPSVISLIDRGALGARIEALDIPVHTLKLRPGPGLLTGPARLIPLLRSLRPDLLQGWMYHGNLAATLAGLITGAPTVWGIHYSLSNPAGERLATRAIIGLSRLLSRWPAATVYVSRISAEQHAAQGFADRNIRIIPNGFDGEIHRPSTGGRQRFRAKIGADEDEILVGLIARYHPMKDHANLLRAARAFSGATPRMRWVLAGPGVDASNAELTALIAGLGLAEDTVLLGECGDVAEILAGLDLLCMSSSHGEAFPMVVGEAMATGLPCIVTDVGDAAWLVGDTGWVVPPRDPDALAAALGEARALGRAARVDCGMAARRRVLEKFSLNAATSAYQDLYQSLLARRSH
jgi:glycosyltransferase involved in cell wall biosynthesis